ncbi:glycine-rich cell wall structural keratin-like [Podarcis lilfordi]|uniref:Glycine-rich cell wall structural keratin-like n=1 Tax=Podarcis lilfordi TaxID=74358 RepID=A0AA35PUJ5_9SAUR|nr:glycine-rich cell wall structural keratin-like [Podarcis lilfordi]
MSVFSISPAISKGTQASTLSPSMCHCWGLYPLMVLRHADPPCGKSSMHGNFFFLSPVGQIKDQINSIKVAGRLGLKHQFLPLLRPLCSAVCLWRTQNLNLKMSSFGYNNCAFQCPPSTVTIQPPPFVVTIPGPEMYCPNQVFGIEQYNPCAGYGMLGGSRYPALLPSEASESGSVYNLPGLSSRPFSSYGYRRY